VATALEVVGRVLLALIFLRGGWAALVDPGGRIDTVALAGLPKPELAVRANGFVMVSGGGLLAVGIAPIPTVTLLALSLSATTLVGHAFWRFDQGPDRDRQIVQFLKNAGLLGGLVLVAAGVLGSS
jgi:putative oxidoreductase